MSPFLVSLLTGVALIGVAALATSCVAASDPPVVSAKPAPKENHPAGTQVLVLGAGCFWCPEPVFEALKGVLSVESGYAGGDKATTTYAEVSSGQTKWAEVIRVAFNPKEISAEDLLRIFFTVHDPTTKDRQGGDVGPQYRSAIFFATADEQAQAERIRKEVTQAKLWPDPIVTTIEPLKHYVRGEDDHQDYWERWQKADPLERSRMNDGYCRMVVDPKVKKFREKLADRLKPEYATPKQSSPK